MLITTPPVTSNQFSSQTVIEPQLHTGIATYLSMPDIGLTSVGNLDSDQRHLNFASLNYVNQWYIKIQFFLNEIVREKLNQAIGYIPNLLRDRIYYISHHGLLLIDQSKPVPTLTGSADDNTPEKTKFGYSDYNAFWDEKEAETNLFHLFEEWSSFGKLIIYSGLVTILLFFFIFCLSKKAYIARLAVRLYANIKNHHVGNRDGRKILKGQDDSSVWIKFNENFWCTLRRCIVQDYEVTDSSSQLEDYSCSCSSEEEKEFSAAETLTTSSNSTNQTSPEYEKSASRICSSTMNIMGSLDNPNFVKFDDSSERFKMMSIIFDIKDRESSDVLSNKREIGSSSKNIEPLQKRPKIENANDALFTESSNSNSSAYSSTKEYISDDFTEVEKQSSSYTFNRIADTYNVSSLSRKPHNKFSIYHFSPSLGESTQNTDIDGLANYFEVKGDNFQEFQFSPFLFKYDQVTSTKSPSSTLSSKKDVLSTSDSDNIPMGHQNTKSLNLNWADSTSFSTKLIGNNGLLSQTARNKAALSINPAKRLSTRNFGNSTSKRYNFTRNNFNDRWSLTFNPKSELTGICDNSNSMIENIGLTSWKEGLKVFDIDPKDVLFSTAGAFSSFRKYNTVNVNLEVKRKRGGMSVNECQYDKYNELTDLFRYNNI